MDISSGYVVKADWSSGRTEREATGTRIVSREVKSCGQTVRGQHRKASGGNVRSVWSIVRVGWSVWSKWPCGPCGRAGPCGQWSVWSAGWSAESHYPVITYTEINSVNTTSKRGTRSTPGVLWKSERCSGKKKVEDRFHSTRRCVVQYTLIITPEVVHCVQYSNT